MLLTTESSVQPQDMIIRKLHTHKPISGSGFIVLERVSLWSSGWLQTFSPVQASPKLSARLSRLPRAQIKGSDPWVSLAAMASALSVTLRFVHNKLLCKHKYSYKTCHAIQIIGAFLKIMEIQFWQIQ